jgi:hypothetical protein
MRCANCGYAVLVSTVGERTRGDGLRRGDGSCVRCGAQLRSSEVEKEFSKLWVSPKLAAPSSRSGARGGYVDIGYIVAGACVMSAALILVLVYFMAMGLEGNTRVGGLGRTNALTVASPLATTPTVGMDATAVASATAMELPGSAFIPHAVTASGVDTRGGSPTAIDATTIFRVGEKVYIILGLHTVGQGGTVCLQWYLNGKVTTQYEFAISAGETAAYSYTIYGEAGAGSVDVEWSSRNAFSSIASGVLRSNAEGACSDGSLAQHVEFVVRS